MRDKEKGRERDTTETDLHRTGILQEMPLKTLISRGWNKQLWKSHSFFAVEISGRNSQSWTEKTIPTPLPEEGSPAGLERTGLAVGAVGVRLGKPCPPLKPKGTKRRFLSALQLWDVCLSGWAGRPLRTRGLGSKET